MPIVPISDDELTLFTRYKVCTGCKVEKPFSDYFKSSNPCGITSRCKLCHTARNRENYLKNYEANNAKAAEKAREKYQEDPEKFKAKAKEWRVNNPEKAHERDHAYDAARKDERKEYRARTADHRKKYRDAYNARERERRLAYNREYYQKNTTAVKARIKAANEAKPEFYADIHRRWKKANPDACRAMGNNRRTRLAGNGGSYTAQEWIALKAFLGNRCLMCNRPESEVFLTFDHIIPVSDGGTSDISNGQSMCRSCNSKKHTKTLDLRPK